ncbi:MEDS domain-containing protein [Bacillus infantis]|uniref:MEDS domain-containing protein n=1 Tax=Bacillus infantis TaxID=324767 RepID=UPI00344DED12
MQVKEVTELRSLAKGHVLYFFEDYDRYLSNVEDFVITGLKLNEYAVIIENDRWIRKIRNKLCESLEERYLQKVAFINNFDFYYAKGDFRVNSIFDFLPKVLDNYSEENSVIRSWAHVEWRNEEEIQGKLLASEEAADGIVSDSKILSVCAYDSDRASQEFKAGLLTNHNYLLLDQ